MGRGRTVVEGDGASFFSAIDANADRLESVDGDRDSDPGDKGGEVPGHEVLLSQSVAQGREGHGRERKRSLFLDVHGHGSGDRLAEAGEAGVEGVEEGVVVQGPYLVLKFDAPLGSETVEAAEIQDDAGTRAVILTMGLEHIVVRVALDDLRGEVHRGCIINPTYQLCVA